MPTSIKKNPDTNDNDFKNNLLSDVKSGETDDDKELKDKNDITTSATTTLITPPAEVDETPTKKLKKRFSIGKVISLIVILLCVVLLSFGGYVAYSLTNVSQQSLGQGQSMNLLDQTKQILGTILNPNQRTQLKGESDGRTNFLLLGTDVAAGLTDTIMLASYYYSDQKLVTVNIPRDTLAYDGYSTQKINAIYAAAANRSKDQTNKYSDAAEYLSGILSKEFGIPIQYWATINFSGVKEVVDELGGVDVNVENSFTDCEYPTDNYSGYIRPCPTFKAGMQHMNGTTALIYARSRHSLNNGEGSDFARAKRQSILTAAILEKIKDENVFENVSKISSYLSIIGNNFKTNLQLDELYSLAVIMKDIDIKNNFLRIEWATGNGFLCTGPDPVVSYTITYCGGAIIGKNQVSSAKQKAKDQIQNLLKVAENGTVLDSQVAIISNQSKTLPNIEKQFDSAGFTDVNVDNADKSIPAIKKGATENVSFYILDPQLKDLYDSLANKPNVGADIQTELPDSVVLPKGYEDSRIIVWIN
jgi:LCP family protein required for cell wall assembly